MNRRHWTLIFKYISYALILIFLHILQSTPSFLSIMGIKPILSFPMIVCIAMFDGEFIGGLFGAFAGLLYGLDSPIIFGFHGVMWLISCVVIGLVIIYIMRLTLPNCMLLTLVAVTFSCLMEYLFLYAIWGYDHVGRIFLMTTLPTILYTAAFSPLFFILFRRLHAFFSRKLED